MEVENLKVRGLRIGWAAVIIWFSANLLSQAVYMGLHGAPYDAVSLLQSIGAWYWVLFAIEMCVWILFGSLLFHRINEKVAVTAS